MVSIAALLAAGPVLAGAPVAIIGPSNVSLTSPAIGAPGATQTLTLTFNANGNMASNAQLNTLALGGTNPADFAIVGGTCQPGTTQLGSGNPTCTVIVQYTAGSAANESALLTGTCTQVNLVGGFTLSCTGTSGTLTSLAGALLAALVATPMLDPKVLTGLCALLLAVGVYFANRKRV
jgi:hypothetical protein